MKKIENINHCVRIDRTHVVKSSSLKHCPLSEEKRSLMKKIIDDRKAALDALAKY